MNQNNMSKLESDDILIIESKCVDSHPCQLMRKDYTGKARHEPIIIKKNLTIKQANDLKQLILKSVEQYPQLKSDLSVVEEKLKSSWNFNHVLKKENESLKQMKQRIECAIRFCDEKIKESNEIYEKYNPDRDTDDKREKFWKSVQDCNYYRELKKLYQKLLNEGTNP